MTQPGRRSQRGSKGVAQRNIFSIDSRSAMLEYVQARPESILQIEVQPKQKDEWETFCIRAGLGPGIVKENSNLDGPVLGTVKLNTLSWHQFYGSEFADDELILVLDHITDPRNLGAIARTAGFYGVRWILAPQHRQVLFTQASVATSMGGFAFVDLVVINNVATCLTDLRGMGFRILGAHMEGTRLEDLPRNDLTAVVLGAEDKGLTPKVREHCDELVAICRRNSGLDSLNVSVAAGIIINHFLS